MSSKSTAKRVYIVKVKWRGTAKIMRIEARDSEEATEKAAKMKENFGFWELELLREE